MRVLSPSSPLLMVAMMATVVMSIHASEASSETSGSTACDASEFTSKISSLEGQVESLKKNLMDKSNEVLAATSGLETAKKTIKHMQEANAASSRSAQDSSDETKSACDASLASANDRVSQHEKTISALKEDLKRAKSEAATAKGSCRDPAPLEKEISELRKKLDRERARHDEEAAELRARAANIGDSDPLWAIAFSRGSERLSEAYERSQVFYDGVILPQSEKLMEAGKDAVDEFLVYADPHIKAFDQATVPARVWIFEQVDQVKPHYDEHVKPHVDTVSEEVDKWIKDAPRIAGEVQKKAKEHFVVFRQNAIQTLQQQPAFKDHAEVLIDAAFILVAIISAILLAGPVLGMIFALVIFVILLPIRIITCGFCCSCCCGRRKKATAATSASTAAAPKSQAAPQAQRNKNSANKK
mmetsp:Transcript_44/g.144  ORF Transcript_44/g.144 Transcript_44/m.144 type:complete len:415 (+) Transcript_44:172-1416(+)|eukprot:CAMPEP_0171498670 /NCGR_PEP_ID=MMETSP0958-20121227/7984_1 /TAXON_ID=87120 /ORGANISM="Aurantiochytrium limacinum, Strain ATCCMYA-1381" /LENGTH=414 /DNA_ID=CAMNT_0012033105 /DNA_START=92 /DNA_END=1336 /DNA_ORIENTATION=-